MPVLSDLSLYGTIAMCLTIGLLGGLIILSLVDRPLERHVAPIEPIIAAARADQLARAAVLGTPTDEHPVIVPIIAGSSLPPRGRGVSASYDSQATPIAIGRHRRVAAAIMDRRPSLTTVGLEEALAWLVVDRVKRDAERAEFQALLAA